MNQSVLMGLRMTLTMGTLVVFTLLLLQYRYSRKVTAWAVSLFTVVVALINLIIMKKMGYVPYSKVMPLTATAPYLILYLFLSAYRDLRLVFAVVTVYSFGLADMGIGGSISAVFFGSDVAIDLFFRMLVFIPIGLFILFYFRKPYIRMLHQMKSGWLIFCAFPLLFYAAFYFTSIYPVILHERPENAAILLCLIGLLFIVYAMLVQFFQFYLDHVEEMQNMELLSSKVSALRDQLEAINNGQEYRERSADCSLAAVKTMIESGDTEAALRFLQQHQAQSDVPLAQYCQNSILNVILSFYLERAKAEGITVKADLRIPEDLPIDALELSAVLTSAIENAIHACLKIPDRAERRLEISCYSSPRFVFEVANTYTGEIVMDENSVPVPPETGPDIATRSINAFVQKYRALADYDLSDGMFRVRVALLDLEGIGEADDERVD